MVIINTILKNGGGNFYSIFLWGKRERERKNKNIKEIIRIVVTFFVRKKLMRWYNLSFGERYYYILEKEERRLLQGFKVESVAGYLVNGCVLINEMGF